MGSPTFPARAPSKSTAVVLLMVLLFADKPSPASSWSSPRRPGANTGHSSTPSRRDLLKRSAATLGGLLTGAGALASPSSAACLQGDLRPVCIGIYKVPLDDAVLPYISTPEQLHKFAPDLTYVPPIEPPKNFECAMDVLKSQRVTADEIKKQVVAGKLEEAGIGVLGLIPKVTTSGRLVLSELEARMRTKSSGGNLYSASSSSGGGGDENNPPSYSSSAVVENLAIDMAEDQMNYLTGYWGECDITIGQGIRGELGRVTVAQLTILSSLQDATRALDDFLVTATTLEASVKKRA